MGIKDRIIEIVYALKDKFSGGVGKVTGGIREIDRASDKSADKIESNNKRATASFLGLGNIVKRVGGIFAGLSLVSFAQDIFSVTRETGKLRASLETVTGSAENAEAAFKIIEDFSATTPFQLEEVADAFIKLKALGLDPSEEALQSYGNTASAMGKSLNQFIEAVADASVGEFERLKEFGIKAKSEGDNVSFTFQGVTTTIKKSAEDIEGFLREIGNVQFAGAMDRQAKTLDGVVSNLKDNFAGLARAFGESGVGSALSGFLLTISEALKDAGKGVKESADEIKFVLTGLTNALRGNAAVIRVAWNGVQATFRVSAAAIVGSLGSIATALSFLTFGEASRRFKKFGEDMRGTAKEILKAVSDDFEDIKQTIIGLGVSLEENEKKAKAVAKAIEEAGAEARDADREFENLAAGADQLTGALRNAENQAKREVDEFNRMAEESDKVRQKFADLTAEIAGTSAKTEGFTFTDVVSEMTNAREALAAGDFEGAIEGAEKAGDMLREMKERGEESDGVLTALAFNIRDIANAAAESRQRKELVDAESSLDKVEELRGKIAELVEGPVQIKLEVDTSGLDAVRNIQPIIVPVRFVQEGGIPGFGDAAGVENIQREADKRGYKP